MPPRARDVAEGNDHVGKSDPHARKGVNEMRKTIAAAVVGAVVLAGGALLAAAPARNVSPMRHPNLAAAQKFSREAFEKVLAAQRANEWDMQGHAQKAKELLDQVNAELKLAAETANQAK